MFVTTKDGLKAQAKRLRTLMTEAGVPISHSEALDGVASLYGRRHWPELSAHCRGEGLALLPRQRVRGTYMNQAFKGEVRSIEATLKDKVYRVCLNFDQPMDVATSAHFQAPRQRNIVFFINDKGEGVNRLGKSDPRHSIQL